MTEIEAKNDKEFSKEFILMILEQVKEKGKFFGQKKKFFFTMQLVSVILVAVFQVLNQLGLCFLFSLMWIWNMHKFNESLKEETKATMDLFKLLKPKNIK